jgi:hypothetical protein
MPRPLAPSSIRVKTLELLPVHGLVSPLRLRMALFASAASCVSRCSWSFSIGSGQSDGVGLAAETQDSAAALTVDFTEAKDG